MWSIRSDFESGNFGFDPLGLRPESAEEYKEMCAAPSRLSFLCARHASKVVVITAAACVCARRRQTKELNNGRLAMIAISGMVVQELATGNKLF